MCWIDDTPSMKVPEAVSSFVVIYHPTKLSKCKKTISVGIIIVPDASEQLYSVPLDCDIHVLWLIVGMLCFSNIIFAHGT